ncbi:hypothetical protein ADIS_3649 [Lunatimonas lonarensis]|uniref:Uncharacterized protein n=2 Tax=Lunatimonas lonarensis TaxID=1232681 RepID=R7ZP79_9BACT|nr:hypothetical protein ADIS_3649 [Lunatimonas lonarensis]
MFIEKPKTTAPPQFWPAEMPVVPSISRQNPGMFDVQANFNLFGDVRLETLDMRFEILDPIFSRSRGSTIRQY